MIATIAAIVLAVYFVLSVIRQVTLVFPRMRAFNGSPGGARVTPDRPVPWNSRLLPVWTFFSAVPDYDVELLIRDRLVDQQYTPWRAAPYQRTAAIRWLWNPDRRRGKAIVDMSARLQFALATHRDMTAVDLASLGPYTGLLTYARGLPRSPLSDQRQFMIARTFARHRGKAPHIMLISPLFPLS